MVPPLVFRDNPSLREHLDHLEAQRCIGWEVIGHSRAGQELFGIRFGTGPRRVSIVAGSHADEPTGPATAQALPLHWAGTEWLTRFTFVVVPQINPDGADVNRAWFSDPPDLVRYAEHAVRESPGDDIEFGFGVGEGIRPENRAAMAFLSRHAPYAAHFSLHGMGFAEGAWYLLCKEWVDRAGSFVERLTERTRLTGLPLHDIDRNDDKGFTRIGPGFCTTPTSTAMKSFFHDDPAMAARFHPSSMEFAQSLGGDPLCMVSELPLFRIGRPSPSLDEPIYWEVIERFKALRTGAAIDAEAVRAFVSDFAITPVPFAVQSALQIAMIEEALETLG